MSKSESKELAMEPLELDRVRFLVDQLKAVIPQLDELASISDEMRSSIQKQIADYALSLRTAKLKPEELESFFKKPYVILPAPGRQDTWHLIMPKFIDASYGWLEQSTEGYNIFLINRYVDWLGELPEVIKKELGFKEPLDLHLDGDMITGSPRALEQAWGNPNYKPFFRDRDQKAILINRKRSFELLAVLIKDGILPFDPKPIDPKDLVEGRRFDFELRPYQKEAWEAFKKWSNVGVFFPASVGKTICGLYAATHLKPRHLVVCPTRLLVEQWQERIEAHTDLKLGEEIVVTTYQTAIKKHAKEEWTLMIADECHHLPSDYFSKLSFIKRKYTMGLSATPQREDKREEYIFSLTGHPVGLGWQYFKDLGIIRSPTCHVWILKDFAAKLRRIEELLKDDRKTLIFSDSIELGRTISKRFDLPHVYGETKDGRLDIIEQAQVVVVSRVADEGVSIPDIQRVIEASYLFGSRRQELQRFTRLLHGREGESDHHILMTLDEYVHDRKRLFSIMDKGFKVVIHREGVSERTIERRAERPYASREPRRSAEREEGPRIEQPVQITTASSGLLSAPGIQRFLKTLNRGQAKFLEFLVKNDGRFFDDQTLALNLGYSSPHSFRVAVNPQRLVGNWVKVRKEGRKTIYGTELGGKVVA